MKQPARTTVLVFAIAAAVVWVRIQPARVDRLSPFDRSLYVVADAQGRERVLLGDYDSYDWLRIARNLLRTGSPCDSIVAGECRDQHTLAPVGTHDRYAESLHPRAIAVLHRVLSFFDTQRPLDSSAFLLPVLIGALAVPPAFGIGSMLGGVASGVVASIVIALHPMVLERTIGGDNDVWNLTLPLWIVFAAARALDAERRKSQVLWAIAASTLTALQAWAWSGWVFAYSIVFFSVVANLVLAVGGRLAGRSSWGIARPAVVLFAFWLSSGVLTRFVATDEPYLEIPVAALSALRPSSPSVPSVDAAWPDALANVGELVRPDLTLLVDWTGGRPLVLAGCFGILLVLFDPARGASVLTVVWFLAAAHLSFGGRRFVLLLVPPLGLGVGALAGRTVHWIEERVRMLRVPARAIARSIVGGAVAALVVILLQRGWSFASGFRPTVDRSWVEALERLRAETPANAIVFSWWDYGHWIKYFAERRVEIDGATLGTHAPAWFARALAASDERRTVGLLRMLACGSDATPHPEEVLGAYGKLRAAGQSDRDARSAVERLASLDRGEAEAWLRSSGLDAPSTSSILASTHCAAPPSYVVLDARMSGMQAWRGLARWRDEPELDGYLAGGPVDCHAAGGSDVLTCPIGARYAANAIVESLTYRTSEPASARLIVILDGRRRSTFAPAEVLVAGRDGIEGTSPAASNLPISALIDPERHRVIVGPGDLLHSTFTGLVLLGGRGSRYFERFDERRAGRLVTWTVRWPD